MTDETRSAPSIAVVTGATDGIGAATALLLQSRGVRVVGLGRSAEKAARVEQAGQGLGRLEFVLGDFSRMREVERAVREIRARCDRIDLLVHCIGTIQPRKARTQEGLEVNFATSYLSRFLLTRELLPLLRRSAGSRVVNVAASSPKIPSFVRVEFFSVTAVESRTGMRGHGQAQLANDVWVAELARREGVLVMAYGPGNVDTDIRRNLPRWILWLMRPFFARSTRQPSDVARALMELSTAEHASTERGRALYYKEGERFVPDPFVTDGERGSALWALSERLVERVLHSTPTAEGDWQ